MVHFIWHVTTEKGTSRQRSGKGAIRKRFPPQKPRREKTKPTIRYLYHETYRKPNEQLFPQQVATQLPQLNQKHENTHKAPTAQKFLNTKT